MKRIEIIAGEATYANLKTFEDIEQLNVTVRHYKDMLADMALRQDVKRNLLTVIGYIKRYSCRFFGVSWRGKRKIAADLKMCDKTITRLCKRLEKLGFIKQYAMKRTSDMQQTSNAIVIQPSGFCVNNGVSAPTFAEKMQNVRQDTEKMSDHEYNTSLKQNPLLHKTYQPTAPLTFYRCFKEFVTMTIGDDQPLISRLFGVYRAHTTILTKYGAYAVEDVEHAGYEALKTAVMASKTKRVRSLPGFYNGVLDRFLDRLGNEESERVLAEI
jgi:hypothetical protein